MNQFIKWLQAHSDVRVTFDITGSYLRIVMQDTTTSKYVSRIDTIENASLLLVDFDIYLVIVLDRLYSKLK